MNCRAMADTLKPRDAKEVEDAVRWALGNEKPLEIAGRGTKRTIGRPMNIVERRASRPSQSPCRRGF